MKREAIYSRNKRMAIEELEGPKVRGYGIESDVITNSINGARLNDDDPFTDVLSFGRRNNYFSTGKTNKRGKSSRSNSSTFSLAKGFNRGNSNRARPTVQPLKVWGSVAGREYGSPEREDEDDDDTDI